jgi:nitrogen fixation NifU-like protein
VIEALRELYQQVILDHGKRPRNFRAVEGATHRAEGFNPLCGDRVMLEVLLEDGIVKDMAFRGSGCAISTASASLMTEALQGRSLAEVDRLFDEFRNLVTGTASEAEVDLGLLGKLAVFSGVREYPTRVKCAVLVWHTLRSALQKREETVTTE